jgi:chorismate mutase
MDNASLETLRREIDRIDNAIHDLVVERASLVEQVAAMKPGDKVPLRPGREALVLRRLIGRHTGAFPRRALVRIWREIMGALVGLQAPFSVAVFQPVRGSGYIELARNHFGVVWPVTSYTSPGQVVRLVADGAASVGVVPIPREGDPEPWWLSLTAQSENLPRVVARLPFAPVETTTANADPLEALVISCREHDATGEDRTMLVLETMPDVSRDRLRAVLTAAGLEQVAVVSMHRDEHAWLHLVDLEGYLPASDPRLEELASAKDPVVRVTVVGGYAVQLPALPAAS